MIPFGGIGKINDENYRIPAVGTALKRRLQFPKVFLVHFLNVIIETVKFHSVVFGERTEHLHTVID